MSLYPIPLDQIESSSSSNKTNDISVTMIKGKKGGAIIMDQLLELIDCQSCGEKFVKDVACEYCEVFNCATCCTFFRCDCCGNVVRICNSCVDTCQWTKCFNCNSKLCDDCDSSCVNCTRRVCASCSVTCDICQDRLCPLCAVFMTDCDNMDHDQRRVCSSSRICTAECYKCKVKKCKDCLVPCKGCKLYSCEACNEFCDGCQELFCDGCLSRYSSVVIIKGPSLVEPIVTTDEKHFCLGCRPKCKICQKPGTISTTAAATKPMQFCIICKTYVCDTCLIQLSTVDSKINPYVFCSAQCEKKSNTFF